NPLQMASQTDSVATAPLTTFTHARRGIGGAAVFMVERAKGEKKMPKIETDTVTLPACWASALINGDESSFSLDDDGGEVEIVAIDAALAPLTAEGWSVIDVASDEET